MSYDIHFLRLAPGQTWDEAEEAAEDNDDDDDAAPDPVAWNRIAAGAVAVLPNAVVHESDEWYELDDDETGIQLNLHAASAELTVPYRYKQSRAESIVRILYRLAAVVEEATGFTGYDPQVELTIAEAVQRPDLAVASFDFVARSFADRNLSSPSNDN